MKHEFDLYEAYKVNDPTLTVEEFVNLRLAQKNPLYTPVSLQDYGTYRNLKKGVHKFY